MWFTVGMETTTAPETSTGRVQPFICPDCETEYPSYARYSRNDECFKARQAARFDAEDAFTAEDVEADRERNRHYGNASVEAADYEPAGPGQTSNQYGTFTNHTPSDKQVAFIGRLAAERGLEVLPEWTRTKSRCSTEIERLLALPKTVEAPAARKPNRYAAKCINCGGQVPAEGGFLVKDASGRWAAEHSVCLATPVVAQVPAYEPIKGDVHVIDGEYYRIHQSQGSDRFYAAHFDGHRFEYERGAISRCTEANKATAAQAAEFGRLYHQCCFCARQLDTPESTAVGYGPVCAKRHGLPWGE